jgi:hypothetical protein
MLELAWSPIATFAFCVLTSVEDNAGFLPGSAFDLNRYHGLSGDEQSHFVLTTSYHAAYMMGFLCSVTLMRDRPPPAVVPLARRSPGAGAAMFGLVNTDGPSPCWREPFCTLTPTQQDAVAPLVLAIVLRQARTAGNLNLIREALEVALRHDLIDGPAPAQAAALLRRSQALKLGTVVRDSN